MPRGIKAYYNYTLSEENFKSMMHESIRASDIRALRKKYPDGSSIPVIKSVYTADGTKYVEMEAIVKKGFSFNVWTTEGTFTWVQIAQWQRKELIKKSI